ncbi:N-acetylmuramic acid 6-phosphate etherase [Novosphingobium sp. 9]|uniref:N-acetylmuramic acid 6-phosphate etherase n=1 Tax=Novosphingobium sp. 9 TaxID=2025349 RepID=UPI0021B52F25|nr:N-acetylmuramic acid 6-phosphate etherase [Novosphingobium sp. 9]
MNTEFPDPRYLDLDLWPTEQAVAAMIEGQMAALAAVHAQCEAIAQAADAAAERLGEAGRLVYVGAGTSGRIAVQDGAELYPTFNWPTARVHFVMAGGTRALIEAVEGAEDDSEAAREALVEAKVGPSDVVIGLAASGRTPFTIAALETARAAGALTIAVANNPGAKLLAVAERPILIETGAEVIAGSTRMKAGTAQKAVLNALSSAIMVKRGLVYRGRMVNMRVSNHKLRQRGEVMVAELSGTSHAEAQAALDRADNDVRLAVLLAQGLSVEAARERLALSGGRLREALRQ